jgi:hypothetical protein
MNRPIIDDLEPVELFAVIITAPDGTRRYVKKWLSRQDAGF